MGHIALAKPTWFGGAEGEEFRVEKADENTAAGKGISRSKLQILEENVWYKLPRTGCSASTRGCGKGGRLIGMKITGRGISFCAEWRRTGCRGDPVAAGEMTGWRPAR